MKFLSIVFLFASFSLFSGERLSPLLKNNDLTFYSNFDELIQGQIKDQSGNRNHSFEFKGEIKPNGIFGKYFELKNKAYIDLDDFRTNPNFTISLWVNIKSLKNGQCFMGKHKNNGDNIFLFGLWAEGYHVRIRNTRHEAGKPYLGWQHLVLTGKVIGRETDLTLYHNGKTVWSKTLQSTRVKISTGKSARSNDSWFQV